MRSLLARSALIALLPVAGCMHIRPHFGSAVFDPQTMEVVGPAEATVTRWYIFGAGPWLGKTEEDNLAVGAAKAAAKAAGGDFLVNVVADEKTQYDFFVLVYRRIVTVHGTAVRYKARAPR